jgi:hypothetical protein
MNLFGAANERPVPGGGVTAPATDSHADKRGAMFDAGFYASVLPDLLQRECRQQAGKVPVVEFHFADGTMLDICHIVQLGENWMVVAFFRDPETCEDMDFEFLPYELVLRITISFHNPKSRRLGFAPAESPSSPTEDAKPSLPADGGEAP